MDALKKPLKYDEQIDRLVKAHNLTVSDIDNAKRILSKTNYYRLSAYGLELKKPGNEEEYLDGTTIEDMYRLYRFDSELRKLIFALIEPLELRLRSQIAYHLGNKYGADCLENRDYFETIPRTKWVNGQRTIVMKNGRVSYVYDLMWNRFEAECRHQSNNPVIAHHNTNYGGHFPVWVAVDFFTLGNLWTLYNIMHKADEEVIAKIYDTRPENLKSWMGSLREVRNVCAHYGRVYDADFSQKMILYPEDQKYVGRGAHRIFPVLLMSKRMLMVRGGDATGKFKMVMRDDEDRVIWTDFVDRLSALIREYGAGLNLGCIGFPTDWEDVLRKDSQDVKL